MSEGEMNRNLTQGVTSRGISCYRVDHEEEGKKPSMSKSGSSREI
jgi:hypothetical protein